MNYLKDALTDETNTRLDIYLGDVSPKDFRKDIEEIRDESMGLTVPGTLKKELLRLADSIKEKS